jgi:hypothetical protein
MQRKGTRKPKTDDPLIGGTSIDLTIAKNSVTNVNDDNNIEYYLEKPEEAICKNPIVSILKYLLAIILLLPWLVQIAKKVKNNDFIPRIQEYIEDSFTCPPVKEIYRVNCTCMDEKLKNDSSPSPPDF